MKADTTVLLYFFAAALAAQQFRGDRRLTELTEHVTEQTHRRLMDVADVEGLIAAQLGPVDARLGVLENREQRRRRTQRDTVGGANVVHILTRQTRTIDCASSWSGRGRFDHARCQDPAFRQCNRDSCAHPPVVVDVVNITSEGGGAAPVDGGGGGGGVPGGGGHRRAQAGPACTAADVPTRSNEVTLECCDEPGEDCANGMPASCNAGCASIFLAFIEECGGALGKGGADAFAPVVELCEAAAAAFAAAEHSTMVSSLAVQLGVECTDGTLAEECVPECSAEVHGFLLLLNIDGADSKLSCELHHNKYSWVGPASEGGFLGSDVSSFVSAIVSGAAGVYVGQILEESASVNLNLQIEPGQHVRVVSGTGAAAEWGSGGLTLSPGAVVVLNQIIFDGSLIVEAGAQVTLDSVQFGPFGCLTARGNAEVILKGGTVAPAICSECNTIEHCRTSQCSLAGIAVCAACEGGYFAMRENDQPSRCVSTENPLMMGAGLNDDVVGVFSFGFRRALPSDMVSGVFNVPPRAAILMAGTGVEVLGATFVLSEVANSLSLERIIFEGQLAITGRGSVTMQDCVMSLAVLSAAMRPVSNGAGFESDTWHNVEGETKPLSKMRDAGSSIRLSAVTIPERPAWGRLAGTITVAELQVDVLIDHYGGPYGPDSGPTSGLAQTGPIYYDPPWLGRAAETQTRFNVSSGPCQVRGDGRCVGRPSGYASHEECLITVIGSDGTLAPARIFDTTSVHQQNYDILRSGTGDTCVQCRNYGNYPHACDYFLPCQRSEGVVSAVQGYNESRFFVTGVDWENEARGDMRLFRASAAWNGRRPDDMPCNAGCFQSSTAPPEGMVFEDGHQLYWYTDGDYEGGSNTNVIQNSWNNCGPKGLCGAQASRAASDSAGILGGGWEVCFV